MDQGKYYTGTSGLLLPVPNKEHYPQEFKERSRLCYYGSLFNSIEVNSSFYKVPMPSTVAKWAADVPEGFRFTFKLFREITHNKELVFKEEVVHRFMTTISAVGDKKGCLLVQFPGSIRPVHNRQLEQLIKSLLEADAGREWKIAIEFRHPTWYTGETYEMLDHYGIGLVLHDKLTAGGALLDSSTDFRYVRFHGPGGNYRGSYTDDFVYEYASYIKEWLWEGKEVYSYFNNTMGNAIGNLTTLKKYVMEGY
jgi:uncharacterized protein YecE (DUF72 family)